MADEETFSGPCEAQLQAAEACITADPMTCSCFSRPFAENLRNDVAESYKSTLAFDIPNSPEFCSSVNNNVCNYMSTKSCCCNEETTALADCLYQNELNLKFGVLECQHNCGDNDGGAGGVGGGSNLMIIALVSVMAALLLCCAGGCYYYFFKCKNSKVSEDDEEEIDEEMGHKPPKSKKKTKSSKKSERTKKESKSTKKPGREKPPKVMESETTESDEQPSVLKESEIEAKMREAESKLAIAEKENERITLCSELAEVRKRSEEMIKMIEKLQSEKGEMEGKLLLSEQQATVLRLEKEAAAQLADTMAKEKEDLKSQLMSIESTRESAESRLKEAEMEAKKLRAERESLAEDNNGEKKVLTNELRRIKREKLELKAKILRLESARDDITVRLEARQEVDDEEVEAEDEELISVAPSRIVAPMTLSVNQARHTTSQISKNDTRRSRSRDRHQERITNNAGVARTKSLDKNFFQQPALLKGRTNPSAQTGRPTMVGHRAMSVNDFALQKNKDRDRSQLKRGNSLRNLSRDPSLGSTEANPGWLAQSIAQRSMSNLAYDYDASVHSTIIEDDSDYEPHNGGSDVESNPAGWLGNSIKQRADVKISYDSQFVSDRIVSCNSHRAEPPATRTSKRKTKAKSFHQRSRGVDPSVCDPKKIVRHSLRDDRSMSGLLDDGESITLAEKRKKVRNAESKLKSRMTHTPSTHQPTTTFNDDQSISLRDL